VLGDPHRALRLAEHGTDLGRRQAAEHPQGLDLLLVGPEPPEGTGDLGSPLGVGALMVGAEVAAHRLERLAGHVLRLLRVADPAGREPGHPVAVPVVELAEGTAVAGPGVPDHRLDVDLGQLGHPPLHRGRWWFVTTRFCGPLLGCCDSAF
jgi:hypothetical protein